MTKSIILSVLAILSLALSFLYEVDSAEPVTAKATALPITPYAINSGKDIAKALEFKLPAPETTIAEDFYSKKLGIHFSNIKKKKLVESVTKWLGTPYRYGKASRKGTDCSGFVASIYREVYGVDLSRSSRSMFKDVKRVGRANMRTGDLVFFRRSAKGPIFHVGIYLKGNKFIHSASSGGVKVSSLNETFYRNTFYTAGRVI